MQSIPPDLARSALDAAPDAMIIIDATGVVRYANRQASVLFGYPHDEIVGKEVEQLMPDRYRVRHYQHREQYIQSVRLRPMGQGLELFGRRRDGTEFPVEISLSPIEDGTRVLTAAAIRDVSDRKRSEAALILAREIADRANQSKGRFLAMASHDLRQPLQTLALLNGSLRRIETDAEAASALAQQEQAIGSMSRLLNALLDISKLESGAIEPEPADFRVGTLLEQLRSEFAALAAKRGLQLEVVDCVACVRSDPALVEQILRNLIANAVKYTHQGHVRVRALHEKGIVRVEVTDSGIGIAPEHMPYIYDEFYQVGVEANSAREGYGLGLSIVQRLVKLLHLRLHVRSKPGKGSSFSLELPASKTHPVAAIDAAQPPDPAHSRQLGKVRLLLVEDDLAVRNATGMLLKVEGYQVTVAGSMGEALRLARELDGIDLLVTDYHLSKGETGTQVISALREILHVPLKAILITGDTSSAIRELPRDPYLRIASKPIRAEELLTLVRALLTA